MAVYPFVSESFSAGNHPANDERYLQLRLAKMGLHACMTPRQEGYRFTGLGDGLQDQAQDGLGQQGRHCHDAVCSLHQHSDSSLAGTNLRTGAESLSPLDMSRRESRTKPCSAQLLADGPCSINKSSTVCRSPTRAAADAAGGLCYGHHGCPAVRRRSVPPLTSRLFKICCCGQPS